MPELMRTIANRLRAFVGVHRYGHRHVARLHVAVSLLDGKPRTHPSYLEGHTRDLSANGLGLVLPAIRLGDRYLTGGSHPLRVTLKLPSGAIQLYALPTRYERLEENGTSSGGYLIGVRIEGMSDKDRALFDQHLSSLKGK